MKIFERSRRKIVGHLLLGPLGLALSLGLVLSLVIFLDDTAVLTNTSGHCASAEVLVPNGTGNEAAIRSPASSDCTRDSRRVATGFVSVNWLAGKAKPEPGALLLLGSGIAGLVYLAVTRGKAGER